MKHRAVLKHREPTPTPVTAPSDVARSLPPEMFRTCAKRVAVTAIIYAAVYAIFFTVGKIAPAPHRPAPIATPVGLVNPGDLLCIFFIVVSAVFAFVMLRKDIAPGVVTVLALAFEVFGSLGIESWMLIRPDFSSIGGLTWNAVWIVNFSLLVPVSPRRNLAATLVAATVTPGVYLISIAAHGLPFDGTYFVWLTVPVYVCAGIGTVSYRMVYRLRADVTKARRMGSYQLVERLGEGGMGEVWRAEHQFLARPAAIKLIRPETLGARDENGRREVVSRFNREVQATSALGSPHTVEIYDYGMTEEGVFYYVMELLRGLDLASLVKAFGPLSPERTVYLLSQVCDSLQEAHAAGLVHRDIKPANVYVCRRGLHYDFAKLLDFGLVKASPGAEKDATRLTMPNVAAGTPAFMAPEVVTGEEEIDHRVDIYALGCLAYFMLTGDTVFNETTPIQMAFAHANKTPDPPSVRSEFSVPPGVEQAIMSCLAKNRNERPRTAAELAASLNAGLNGTRWDETQAERWWRNHLPDLVAPGLSAGTSGFATTLL